MKSLFFLVALGVVVGIRLEEAHRQLGTFLDAAHQALASEEPVEGKILPAHFHKVATAVHEAMDKAGAHKPGSIWMQLKEQAIQKTVQRAAQRQFRLVGKEHEFDRLKSICEYAKFSKSFPSGKFFLNFRLAHECSKKSLNTKKIFKISKAVEKFRVANRKKLAKQNKKKCNKSALKKLKKSSGKKLLAHVAAGACAFHSKKGLQVNRLSSKAFGLVQDVKKQCQKAKRSLLEDDAVVESHYNLLEHLEELFRDGGKPVSAKVQKSARQAIKLLQKSKKEDKRLQAAYCPEFRKKRAAVKGFLEANTDISKSGKLARAAARAMRCACSRKKRRSKHCQKESASFTNRFLKTFSSAFKDGVCDNKNNGLVEGSTGLGCEKKGLSVSPANAADVAKGSLSDLFFTGQMTGSVQFCMDVTPTTSCTLALEATVGTSSSICITGSCTFNGVLKVAISICPKKEAGKWYFSITLKISVCLPGLKTITDKFSDLGLAGFLNSIGISDGCLLIAEGGYDTYWNRLYLQMSERCIGLTGLKGCLNAGVYFRVKSGPKYADGDAWQTRDTSSGRCSATPVVCRPWFNFQASVRAEYPTCTWEKTWYGGYPSCGIASPSYDLANVYTSLGA